jgi:hypothetical protein
VPLSGRRKQLAVRIKVPSRTGPRRQETAMGDEADIFRELLPMLRVRPELQAIAADPSSLSGHRLLTWSHGLCHLARWGPEPERALECGVVRRRTRAGHRCARRPDADPLRCHTGPARRTGARHRRLASVSRVSSVDARVMVMA